MKYLIVMLLVFSLSCKVYSQMSNPNDNKVLDDTLENVNVPNYKKFNSVSDFKKHYNTFGEILDISHYDNINWSLIDTSRTKFMFIKCTNGTTSDLNYRANYNSAVTKGICVGSYHFFTHKTNPLLQAKKYCEAASIEGESFLPVIDVEGYNIRVRDPNNPKAKKLEYRELWCTKSELVANLNIYIKYIKEFYKIDKVIIYTGEDFYDQYLKKDFKNEYFWIAHYETNGKVKCPTSFDKRAFEKASSKNGIIAWQYTECGGPENGILPRTVENCGQTLDRSLVILKFLNSIKFKTHLENESGIHDCSSWSDL